MREEEAKIDKSRIKDFSYNQISNHLLFDTRYDFRKTIALEAVFTGAVIMIGLNFLLFLLTLGLDISIYPVSTNGKIAFALGSFLFLAIATIIIMFVGGWVAGYLGRPYTKKRNTGEIYGFSAWALALIITIVLTSQSTQFITNSSYVINRDIPIRAMAVIKNTAMENAAVGTSANLEKTDAQTLMQISFAMFFLAAIGGLSAAFGGRAGMQYKRKEEFYKF